MFTALRKSATSAARQLRVKSALNPMLWLTGIATPVCFCAAYTFRERTIISAVLLGAGLLPIFVTCGGFAYFAIRSPEKLQSEDYQLRHEALLIIQQKSGALELDPASLPAIANPAPTSLPPGDEGKR